MGSTKPGAETEFAHKSTIKSLESVPWAEIELRHKSRIKSPGGVPSKRRPAAAVTGFGWHGGAVVASPQVCSIYLGGAWDTDATHQQLRVDLWQYFVDLFASDFMNIVSQYGVGNGAGTTGQRVNQTTIFGVGNVTLDDTRVQQLLQYLINNRDLPEPQAPYSLCVLIYLDDSIPFDDPGTGIVMCEQAGDTAFGYHGHFQTNAGHPMYYAVMPSLSDTCLWNSCLGDPTCTLKAGQSLQQRITQVTSHELAEMWTDPQDDGWRGPTGSDEIGDYCAGQSATITVSGRTWTVQSIYSYQDDINNNPYCVSGPANPIPQPNPWPRV